MAFWAAAQLEPRRERLAEHFLRQIGYEVYLPRLRQSRILHGRKVVTTPPLFPGYASFSFGCSGTQRDGR
jgi:hypothetical protein